jgi:citrate lyase subunit beta/citryl-CoA lyase
MDKLPTVARHHNRPYRRAKQNRKKRPLMPRTLADLPPRSLLYVPASNARALEKAAGLAADMIIIDLEDSVPAERKVEARSAMCAAVARGFGERMVAVRINGADSTDQAADLAVLTGLTLDAIVVPKVDAPAMLDAPAALGLPILAMIESPSAVFDARAIAADVRVAGLLAGLNDLAHGLRLPDYNDRGAMRVAIQTIMLAARAAGKLAFDGVWAGIDDGAGFEAEAREGRRFGFDGKTLIHPSQVDPCNRIFGPSEAQIDAARALVAAATGGAQRHGGAMVEEMHVDAARRLLARVDQRG